MPEFDPQEIDQLVAAAHHAERVASRRLAKRDGLTEMAALRLTLEQAAGAATLPELMRRRGEQRAAATQRLGARRREKEDQLARKNAARQAPAAAWLAWFDGSAHPNPGKMGIGALLAGPAGQRVEISQAAGWGSSSEAEYAALIAVLTAAVAAQPAELYVYGDSQVVIDDINGRHRRAAAKGLASQRGAAARLLAQLPLVTLRWIPRHRNGAADRLSQQAVANWHGVTPARAGVGDLEVDARHAGADDSAPISARESGAKPGR